MTQKDISVSLQTIESFNSSKIDSRCERRVFVRNPKKIKLDTNNFEIQKKLILNKHPLNEIEGHREWSLEDLEIYVDALEDWNVFIQDKMEMNAMWPNETGKIRFQIQSPYLITGTIFFEIKVWSTAIPDEAVNVTQRAAISGLRLIGYDRPLPMR